MKQSPNDAKQYHSLTLANGLRVLLVCNQDTEKSAAALTVNVGHFDDPIERQGLAHFLEHMLFLGTEKYPDGSEYQQFISQHGGSNNAWTATEHTCYFFDIHHHHFEAAVDRFSQFFTAPLLSEEFVNKERKNIDSEFKLKLKDDIRRLYDVHKETINQQHPFAKFSVGSSETLADKKNSNLRDEVAAFFTNNYYAQLMTLVLEGPQSIAELSALAEEKFSAIPARATAKPAITTPLYLHEHLQKLLKVQPVKNDQQLIISFAMPSIDKYYRHKPESILAYLLGHEGPGSILSLLKSKQWAMSLTAGAGINGSNFKDFNVSIALSELGESHQDDIISVVFSYIALLNAAPINSQYYKEKQSLAELSFNYQEQLSPLDSVCQLVINMQHYPPQDYIFGDYVMDGLNQNAITDLLGYMQPSNMRIISISQQHQGTQTSKWYQVPYSIEDISAEKINQWQNTAPVKELFLPPKNAYIVANPKVHQAPSLTTEPSPPLTPQQICNEDGLSLWFKQDSTFKTPKGYIYLAIDSQKTIEDATAIAMTRLFVDLYSDGVIEEHYDAELAGIHYHLYSHQGGVTLQLSGISEKQEKLLPLLMRSLIGRQFCQQKFELFKRQLMTHWKNAEKSKSISQLFSLLSSTMQPKSPSNKVLLKALDSVSFEQFVNFSNNIFSEISIDALIHGNWLKSTADKIVSEIRDIFSNKLSNDHQITISSLDIAKQGNKIIPVELPQHDHAAVIYFPLPDKDLKTVALTMLTNQLLSPIFFQKMRTEQQYGYLVGVGFVPVNRYPGIAFYIQSPHTLSQTLTVAMETFIGESSDYLSTLTQDNWQHVQQGLASQLQEKDNSLRIKSQRFWAEICNKETSFTQKQALIEIIKTLTLNDIISFIQCHLQSKSHADRLTFVSYENNAQRIAMGLEKISDKNIADFIKKSQRKY